MGTVNITAMTVARGGSDIPLPILRATAASKNLASSGASANTTLPAGGEWVRVLADTACSVKLSVGAGAAVVTDFRLAAGIPEYLPIDNNTYINVIE